jgi:multidrug efflux pump subunit AcrB
VDAAIIVTETFCPESGTPRETSGARALAAASRSAVPIAFATFLVIAVFLPSSA